MPARRLLSALLIAFALAAPAASAWTVGPAGPDDAGPRPRPAGAAWTTDLAPAAFPADALAAVPTAAACALGDVTGDGIADLAVLVQGSGGSLALEARAGPTFEQVAWRVSTRLERVLQCAPDLDLDGTLDPIIRTAGETTGTAAGAAVDQARNVVQQTLDGASGAALVGRVDPETVTGLAGPGVQAAQNATALLLPAAEGAVAFLQGSASAATAQLPVPLPPQLPLAALGLTATQTARLQVLDITGSVVATVEVAEAGVEPLALAPVQLSGALPDVAVLSQVTGPVQQAAAGVPELALYAADGTLAWSTQLPATTGLPILVPNAGDLDLDGVGDLIVTTVEQPLQAAPGSAYHVLSGVDGSILFDSGAAATGLVSALPLGDLPDGPALLEAALAPGAAQLSLQALGGTGQVLWSAQVDALARPVNQVLDPYTQDLLGFTDLTGDAVPDIAVATNVTTQAAEGGLTLQALDGLTGELAWEATLPDVQQVLPVVIGPAQLLGDAGDSQREDQAGGDGTNRSTEVADQPGLQGIVDRVEEAGVGQASLLLGVGHDATTATLVLLEGATGEVLWNATADLPSTAVKQLTATVAGDLDGDRIQDLLVTASAGASVAGGAGSLAPDAAVAAVSGATGRTIWANATTPAVAEANLEFGSTFGPASADAGEAEGAPGPAPLAALAATAVALLLARRRRA